MSLLQPVNRAGRCVIALAPDYWEDTTVSR